MSNTANTSPRKAGHAALGGLSDFIDRCLDPLPAEAVVDTHYNSLVRRTRKDAWRRARAKSEYYEGLHQAASALDYYCGTGVEQPVALPCVTECVRLYRQAVADQMLTPCEQQKDVAWKRRQLSRHQNYWYFPVERDRVERSIAEDEAFLTAHPTAIRKARRAKREDLT